MNQNGVVEYGAMPDRGTVPMKLLLTISEATQVLAISRSKLYELLNSGHLQSVHIGRSRRIRMTDLEEFVKVGGHAF
jgi:excisionase family DNA binding protein